MLPKAALVEAAPSSRRPPTGRDNGGAVVTIQIPDRADDIQAEAKAMARAVNATVYSPELLARQYGSHPIKVSL